MNSVMANLAQELGIQHNGAWIPGVMNDNEAVGAMCRLNGCTERVALQLINVLKPYTNVPECNGMFFGALATNPGAVNVGDEVNLGNACFVDLQNPENNVWSFADISDDLSAVYCNGLIVGLIGIAPAGETLESYAQSVVPNIPHQLYGFMGFILLLAQGEGGKVGITLGLVDASGSDLEWFEFDTVQTEYLVAKGVFLNNLAFSSLYYRAALCGGIVLDGILYENNDMVAEVLIKLVDTDASGVIDVTPAGEEVPTGTDLFDADAPTPNFDGAYGSYGVEEDAGTINFDDADEADAPAEVFDEETDVADTADDEATDTVADEAADEAADEVAEEVVGEAADEVVGEAADEVVGEAADEVAEEVVGEAADEVVDNGFAGDEELAAEETDVNFDFETPQVSDTDFDPLPPVSYDYAGSEQAESVGEIPSYDEFETTVDLNANVSSEEQYGYSEQVEQVEPGDVQAEQSEELVGEIVEEPVGPPAEEIEQVSLGRDDLVAVLRRVLGASDSLVTVIIGEAYTDEITCDTPVGVDAICHVLNDEFYTDDIIQSFLLLADQYAVEGMLSCGDAIQCMAKAIWGEIPEYSVERTTNHAANILFRHRDSLWLGVYHTTSVIERLKALGYKDTVCDRVAKLMSQVKSYIPKMRQKLISND